MILICPTCLKAAVLRAPFEAEEVQHLQGLKDEDGTWPCVREGCQGRMVSHPVLAQAVRERPGRYDAEQFSAVEFLQAARGFGSPKEKYMASPKQLKDILLGARIGGLRLRRAGSPDRTVVERITVENYGLRLDIHLAAGGKGATIYKVTDHVEHGDGRAPAHREQGGQPPQAVRDGPPRAGADAEDADERAGLVPGLQPATEVRD